jgi:hypothetical protein
MSFRLLCKTNISLNKSEDKGVSNFTVNNTSDNVWTMKEAPELFIREKISQVFRDDAASLQMPAYTQDTNLPLPEANSE